jgi:broad specificity phosphatase PhoE
MPVIHLVRHGQASFGTDEYDVLSPTGQQQAVLAGRELVRRGVRSPIFGSGTLARQRDTATIVATEFGVTAPDLIVDPRWDEFDAHALVARYLGIPEIPHDMTSAEFQVHLDQAFIAWIEGTDGTWAQFSDGVLGGLADFAAQVPRGSDGIVATSAGVTAALVARLLRSDAAGVITLNKVSINASLTTVLSGSQGLTLLTFNDHAHVIGHAGMLTTR